jgi:hypothetical protein
MVYVDPEALEAVEGILECMRGSNTMTEEEVVRLTGVPATEVRAALHAIAEQHAKTRRSSRAGAGPNDSVGEFLRSLHLK